MDFSSSSSPTSVSLAAASSSNGNNGDDKNVRETVSLSSALHVVSGPEPMEDDVALSVAAGFANEAWLLFRSGKFTECVDVLNQLLQIKENDPKVHHNIAIAESFQDGCSVPKSLLDRLNDLKKRAEELALASEEQTDASNMGNKVLSGSKGNHIIGQRSSGSNSSPAVGIAEYDTSVIMFNIAFMWFHFHEYTKSFSILDRLYQNIEPIDEGTALHICLLLLDVGLLSYQFSRCADVITYVERVFCINSSSNPVDNGNLAQEQTNLGSKSALLSSNAVIFDSSNPDSSADAHVLDSSLARTLSEEGLEDESLQLLSSLDIIGENLSRPHGGDQSPKDVSKTRNDDSVSIIDLRLKLQLHKVCFFLLTRNLKAAKREVKMAMNVARGRDYTSALYLKSQLEYARGNHQKAIKLLVASINRAETTISSIFLNNLGCIYHQIGKYHTSTVLFLKAMKSSSSLQKEKPPKLLTISQDKNLQMMYNCGVNYLACGKPLPAVRCFQKASAIYYNRPLLWLRIAECCLMALKGQTLSSNSAAANVLVHVAGKGKWRQLVVDGVSRSGQSDTTAINNKEVNLSISFARQCLLNALHLLENSDSKRSMPGLITTPTLTSPEGSESADSFASRGTNHKHMSSGGDANVNVNANGNGNANAYSAAAGSCHAITNGEVRELKGGANGLNMSFMNSISDYEDICRKENQMVKQAILADLAYVELELENPLSALSTAKSLLKLPECSKAYIFLAKLYAAEALCMLNRPKEAYEHLCTYVAGDSSVELPYSQDDVDKREVEKIVDSDEASGASVTVNNSSPEESEGFKVLKPEDSHGILYANLAALYAIQGDYEHAQQVVKQALSIIPNYPEVILTAIYLDLLQGKTHDAIAKLKQCNRISFVSGNQKVNGVS